MRAIRYNDFFNDLLSALYFENRLQEDIISFSKLASRYGIKYERGYLAEAARELIGKGLLRGPQPMTGDDTAIGRLTGEGLRYAEDRGLDDLIEVDHDTDLSPNTVSVNEAPASDRIVHLDHNQARDIDATVSDVIGKVESSNGDPDDLGFRQRVLGQLRAGRELLRAGEFKAHLLQVTLVAGLNELIARYADGIIVGLATNLLQYILTNGLSGQ